MNKEGWRGMKNKNLCMNMHIHIWTLVSEKDNGDSGPFMTIQPCPIQRHKFSAEA